MALSKLSRSIRGSVAVVTGAASGMGRATAHLFGDEGARVALLDVNNAALEKVQEEMNGEGYDSKAWRIDLSDGLTIKKVFSEISEHFGGIDILINNAGNNRPAHFTKVKKEDMEYMVKINTIASFNLAHLCALKMIKSKNRKKKGGAIVNMSSQMGHVGGPIRSVYNMNKFGLEGLTKGMSIDLAKYNIRVNTVCPTFVVTPMTKKFLKDKKFKRDMLNNIPLGRFAELSEVASAVVFLASDAASMITGTSLLVDGGWTAK